MVAEEKFSLKFFFNFKKIIALVIELSQWVSEWWVLSSILQLSPLIYPIFTWVDLDPECFWIRIQYGSGSTTQDGIFNMVVKKIKINNEYKWMAKKCTLTIIIGDIWRGWPSTSWCTPAPPWTACSACPGSTQTQTAGTRGQRTTVSRREWIGGGQGNFGTQGKERSNLISGKGMCLYIL